MEFDEVQVIDILGALEDITEIKKLEEKIDLKQRKIIEIEKRYEIIVEESSGLCQIMDRDGTIQYISGAVKKITGYKPEEILDKNLFDFFTGKEMEKFKKMVELSLSEPDKIIEGNLSTKTKKDENIYLEVIIQNLLDEPAIEGIVINFKDISKRVEMEKKIDYINTHDRLTGLPNYEYCTKKLILQSEYAIENRTTFALMILDIDELKYIKYSLGYEVGNQIVIEIIERLKDYLSEQTFISRYSENTFAIIVQGLRELGYYQSIASGIIDLFNKSYKVGDYELNISANIGICVFPKCGNDMESLRKHAKAALLQAREKGKNTYKFYCCDLDMENHNEFILKSDLNNALKNEEISIKYQPMIKLKSNCILGAETSLKWDNPHWGEISPEEFIPLAEETGIIKQIENWTLRQVCKDYKSWLRDRLPSIKVSVDFSGIQLHEKGFAQNIKAIIDEFKLDPSFLIIVITESVLVKDTDNIANNLQILQSYGIQIAIDDLGTGFASLPYINSLNLDILKLDRSFIKNIGYDDNSAYIAKSMINLAKELKIKLVVEGIEKGDQLSLLKDLNCYTGQGYIYCEPVSLNEFKKKLAKKKCRPDLFSGSPTSPPKERRDFFRVRLFKLLEGELTILEISNRKINVGSTKILIKNIGPGGVCFVSNIKIPKEKDIALQLTTNLLDKEIKVCGHLVWAKEIDYNLQEYRVKFRIDENERMELIRILNEV